MKKLMAIFHPLWTWTTRSGLSTEAVTTPQTSAPLPKRRTEAGVVAHKTAKQGDCVSLYCPDGENISWTSQAVLMEYRVLYEGYHITLHGENGNKRVLIFRDFSDPEAVVNNIKAAEAELLA